jgi:hypothetical protein
MILWTLSFLLLFLALSQFSPVVDRIQSHFMQQRIIDQFKDITAQLRVLKECLESGLVPEREEWDRVAKLPAPWGVIFSESLNSLRSRGAPILPSIERMLLSIEEERALLLESRLRSSQAFGQVTISTLLVPFFGLVIYFLMPEIAQNLEAFLVLMSVSLLMVSLAFFWMLLMMEDARAGKIARSKRSWLLSSKLFFERLIAEIASGNPPDLAWNSAMLFLEARESELLGNWGVRIWDRFPPFRQDQGRLEDSILRFGQDIRKIIQMSLTEGAASMDRLDAAYRNYLLDTRTRISRELQVLPNHCLKPLFILVLPAVMLLLFGSMAMVFGGKIG